MIFLDQIYQKRTSKRSKLNITIELCKFELVYAPNFGLNWKFSFFGSNLPRKDISKMENLNITIAFCMFELLWVPIFTLHKQFWILGPHQICLKREFSVKNKKSEQNHWILHIWISLGTKFQLNWKFWFFGHQIYPKRTFMVQKSKTEHHHWILYIRSRYQTLA